MNDKVSVYPVCETDYLPLDNSNYALIMRFKREVDVTLILKIMQTDYGNMSYKKIVINNTKDDCKIYDLTEQNKGISFMLIKGNNYYSLYVKGNYVGVPIKLFVESSTKANYVEFISLGKFIKNGPFQDETLISASFVAKDNGTRVSLKNQLQNDWKFANGYYTKRNDIAFVHINIIDGTITDDTTICTGLPLPQQYVGENAMVFMGAYKIYGEDDKLYPCRLNLDGNGNLKIKDVKGNARLLASFSYPVRNNEY